LVSIRTGSLPKKWYFQGWRIGPGGFFGMYATHDPSPPALGAPSLVPRAPRSPRRRLRELRETVTDGSAEKQVAGARKSRDIGWEESVFPAGGAQLTDQPTTRWADEPLPQSLHHPIPSAPVTHFPVSDIGGDEPEDEANWPPHDAPLRVAPTLLMISRVIVLTRSDYLS
jgi:hypothetical protein